jgi:hypothetical protein
MSKKLIITERQFRAIKKHIDENVANVRLRNQIHEFLESDYEASGGVEEIANEFYPKALIKKKINGEVITPAALYKYMKHKFMAVDETILKDCLEGWFKGDYDKETGMRKRK